MNEGNLPKSGPPEDSFVPPEPAGPADGNAAQESVVEEPDDAIQLQRLNAALAINLGTGSAVDVSSAGDRTARVVQDQLDELAEDMLHLMKRVESIEECLAQIAENLAIVKRNSTTGYQALGEQLGQVQESVAGERKGMAVLSVFNSILPTLEILQAACAGLVAEEDTPVQRQMKAVVDVLRRLLRDLGFSEYLAQLGEQFDPHRMECVGYMEGDPGIVLEAVDVGYQVQTTVVRRAGVKLADPGRGKRELDQEKHDEK